MVDLLFQCPPLPHYIVSGEDTYARGARHISRSRIGVFDLIVVTKGVLFLAEKEDNRIQEHALTPGDFHILRPDLLHYAPQPCTEPTSFCWLHFHTTGHWRPLRESVEPLAEERDFFHIKQVMLSIQATGHLPGLESAVQKLEELRLLDREPARVSLYKQQLLFQNLLLQLSESQHPSLSLAPAYQLAERAGVFLKQNYRQPLTSAQIGKALSFHPAYINRCLKQVYGLTALEYLTKVRVDMAKLLLMNTTYSIERIAAEVGYASPTYFIRRFKELEAQTPLAYRRSLQP